MSEYDVNVDGRRNVHIGDRRHGEERGALLGAMGWGWGRGEKSGDLGHPHGQQQLLYLQNILLGMWHGTNRPSSGREWPWAS